jgi:predicted small metal-binding protein
LSPEDVAAIKKTEINENIKNKLASSIEKN